MTIRCDTYRSNMSCLLELSLFLNVNTTGGAYSYIMTILARDDKYFKKVKEYKCEIMVHLPIIQYSKEYNITESAFVSALR